jgi:alkylation response protein AidB-like acyl-CoA dehydrogenase
MSHGPFPIDEHDIRFVLFDYLNVTDLFDRDAFSDASREDAEMILKEGWRFAREKVWPTYADGDRVGCRWEAGQVSLPESFKKLYGEYTAAGWQVLTSGEEYGGAGMPAAFGIGAAEAFVGANLPFSTYPGLSRGVSRVVENFGDDWQQQTFVGRLYSGEWAGTMCLTEPHAGTAVGDLRTTATRQDNGRYRVRGTKIFITGGEQDLTDQIVHLVLARTPDAPKGIKGVSLFLVPKRKILDDGSLGESNDVLCTGIEHKMGLNGSATCQLSFGDDDACEGYLVGEENQGIQYMFQLMNEARIGTGLHGLAAASVAYQLALTYAKERVQGTELENLKDVDAPRVPIIVHPDVKRMLWTMKAKVEGMRALLFKSTFLADDSRSNPDAAAGEHSQKVFEILTPLVKSHCSDVGFDVAIMAMQTFGGAGYTADHPVEQLARDVKIASIYEGANGIQALDLIGRKLSKNHGELFLLLMEEIGATLDEIDGHPALGDLVADVRDAQTKVREVTGKLAEWGLSGRVTSAALGASSFLTMLSQLVTAWLLLDQAQVAHDKLSERLLDKGVTTPEQRAALLEDDELARFYENKQMTARFYVRNLLPQNDALARTVLEGELGILEARL